MWRHVGRARRIETEHLDHDELQSQRPQTRINTQIVLGRMLVCVLGTK